MNVLLLKHSAFVTIHGLGRPNVLSLSCAAGPACRSRCGATAAATDEKLPEEARCGRRDAATLAPREVEWAAGRSRAATASAKS